MMKELRRRDIRLLFVLHHFATPIWFNEQGGWENIAKTRAMFANYVDQCIDHFGEMVEWWNTL